MLKRIRDWEQRADQICNEILEFMPEQYLGLGANRTERQLLDLYRTDPVAAGWLAIHEAATSLTFDLCALAREIVDRNARKGITLEDRPTKKPDDALETEEVGCEKGPGE